MNNDTIQPPQAEGAVAQREKWYTPLTKVTPLSRVLALILFIALPFIGFWFGMQYSTMSQNIDRPEWAEQIRQNEDGSKTDLLQSDSSAVGWHTYQNQEVGIEFLYWGYENEQIGDIQTGDSGKMFRAHTLLPSSIDTQVQIISATSDFALGKGWPVHSSKYSSNSTLPDEVWDLQSGVVARVYFGVVPDPSKAYPDYPDAPVLAVVDSPNQTSSYKQIFFQMVNLEEGDRTATDEEIQEIKKIVSSVRFLK